ncbi:MAG TPA: serine/threonine-protein kinase, partial [Myxococcaceae bacterium]|nr:serine/threonine-protein kinase [Myxococcaceae bacterium]
MATLARANATGHSAAYLQVGSAVGRYFVLRPLGAGAMGVVYEAYDPQLNRKIALKILRPEPTRSERDTGELLHEAQAMAQLTHPNVRAIFDVGMVDGQVFIAMEHVDGVTLAAWLHQSRRSAREVLAMFVDAGAGLAAAHGAGVVHGDFKPDNVLVGADGRVRVTDFGLATYSNESGEAPSPRRGGTPGFMAPEQEAGGVALAQSDQYSFCVALNGALQECQGRVPASVRSLVSKGLSPSPENRHPSMSALLQDLRRAQERRRQSWVVGACLSALVLAAVATGVTVRSRRQLCKSGGPRWASIWNASRRARVAKALQQTGAPYARTVSDRLSPLLDAYGERWERMFDDACEATWIRGEQSAELMDRRVACLDDRLGEVDALLGIFEGATADTPEGAIQATAGLPTLDLCVDAKALAQPFPKDMEKKREQLGRIDALRLAGKYAQGVRETAEAVSAVEGTAYPAVRAQAALALGRLQILAGDRKAAEPPLVESAALALEGKDARG